MKMVCFCEKVHFRFLYTPSLGDFMPFFKTKLTTRSLKTKNFSLPLCPDELTTPNKQQTL